VPSPPARACCISKNRELHCDGPHENDSAAMSNTGRTFFRSSRAQERARAFRTLWNGRDPNNRRSSAQSCCRHWIGFPMGWVMSWISVVLKFQFLRCDKSGAHHGLRETLSRTGPEVQMAPRRNTARRRSSINISCPCTIKP
jgi:hypothetical protein